jgi:hypothetical protein
MAADLKDFFSAIGKAKKDKEDEVRSLVGEIDIDSMFSQVKVSIEEDNKKKEEQKKQIAALESWLYTEVVVKEEEIAEESTPIVVPHEEIEEEVVEEIEEEVVEEIEEEIEEEVVEVEDDNTVDQALKILETIKSKEEIRENVSDPEIIKIRRELEYLKNLVNAQGGGGEVRLEFLDDIDRDTTKVDGKFLKYEASSGKWIGVDGGSSDLDSVLEQGNTSTIGINVGIVTATGLIVDPVGSGTTFTEDMVVVGNARVTDTLSVGTATIIFDGSTDTLTVGTGATISSAGEISASSYVGSGASITGVVAEGLTGTPNIQVDVITASSATFTGNVSIAGTLTYEDVTNVDSIGIVTARSGIEIGGPVILNLNTSTSTTTSTSQSAVDTFSVTDYRSASYQVQITRGTEYHVTSLNIVHDGTDVYVSEFGTINTGSVLASFTADINSGSVRILATPTTAVSTVFKMYRNLIRA